MSNKGIRLLEETPMEFQAGPQAGAQPETSGNGRLSVTLPPMDDLSKKERRQVERIVKNHSIQRERKHGKRRIMRVIAGGAMVMFTPKKSGLIGALTKAAGLAMVINGVTGWDPLSLIHRSSDDYLPQAQ